MKNYLGIFVICLIGCYLCILSFAIFPYLALVIIALILSGIISSYIRQGEKIEELEKRIHSLEMKESADSQVLTEKENS
ncbi:MAG: hypothetical protein KHZ58_09555 [Hungatella hathewayi]|nr:hypothetical protein [Hungatella hathewayi]